MPNFENGLPRSLSSVPPQVVCMSFKHKACIRAYGISRKRIVPNYAKTDCDLKLELEFIKSTNSVLESQA